MLTFSELVSPVPARWERGLLVCRACCRCREQRSGVCWVCLSMSQRRGWVEPRVSDFQFPVQAAEHTVPLPSRFLGCRSVEQRQILYEATRINNPVRPLLPFFEGRHLWNPESGRNQALREAGGKKAYHCLASWSSEALGVPGPLAFP